MHPVVLILAGLPGTGKSRLAYRLAAERGWQVVSRDQIRLAMFGPSSTSEEEKQVAFRSLVMAIRTLVENGQGVIVDGMPFSRPGELEEVYQAAVQAGGYAIAVLLHISPRLAGERIAAAQAAGEAMAADRNPDLPTQVAKRFRDFPKWVHRIDSHQPPEQVLAEANWILDQPPSG